MFYHRGVKSATDSGFMRVFFPPWMLLHTHKVIWHHRSRLMVPTIRQSLMSSSAGCWPGEKENDVIWCIKGKKRESWFISHMVAGGGGVIFADVPSALWGHFKSHLTLSKPKFKEKNPQHTSVLSPHVFSSHPESRGAVRDESVDTMSDRTMTILLSLEWLAQLGSSGAQSPH